MPLLRSLVCSLRASNPGALLIVITGEGDELSRSDHAALAALSTDQLHVEVRVLPDLNISNTYHPRFGLNWIKLHSWALTEFDSIINLDSDMVVLGDLSHLHSLPVDFAWVSYQGPRRWWHQRGGMVFLRPCKAVHAHFMQLLARRPELHFTELHAEQTFLDWHARASDASTLHASASAAFRQAGRQTTPPHTHTHCRPCCPVVAPGTFT